MSDTPSPDPASSHSRAELTALTGRAAMPAHVRDAGGMRKIEWVLNRPLPRQFVQSLATGELYYLICDVGRQDAWALVELASDDQLQGIFDIDLWSAHEPRLDRWLGWLDVANEADLDQALRLAKLTEPELLQLFILKNVSVHTKDLELDTVPDQLQILPTPDGEFIVTYDRDHPLADRFPQLLKLLWAADMPKMLDVFQTVRFELPATVTELLLHFRRGRLEEMGFTSADEAAAVYAWLDPARVRREVREQLAELPALLNPSLGRVAEDLVLHGVEAPSLLAAALDGLEPEERSRVAEALTYLIHKVFMAWTGDLSLTDQLPAVGRHATALVNLGLGHVADESPATATEVLRRIWPERLFRVGYTLTVELGRRARHLQARSGVPEGLNLFGERVDEALAGLGRLRPVYFEGLDGGGRLGFRDIESQADLSRLTVAMDDAEAVLGFFEASLHFSPDAMLAGLARSGVEPGEVRLTTLFRTGLAQALLTDAFAFEPLSRDDLASFLGLVVSHGDGDTVRRSDAAETLLTSLGEHVEPTVRSWMTDAVDELVLALGRVAAHDLDPRYASELVLIA